MAGVGVLLHAPCQFVAVHLGHHHVADDEVEFLPANDVESLAAVLGNEDVVLVAQQLTHEHEQVEVVFDNQQFVAVLVGRLLFGRGFHFLGQQVGHVEDEGARSVEVQLVLLVDLLTCKCFLVDG